jgi:hypothetical protein
VPGGKLGNEIAMQVERRIGEKNQAAVGYARERFNGAREIADRFDLMGHQFNPQ